jgi:hypothetical protein
LLVIKIIMLNNCIVSSMKSDSDIMPVNILFRFEQKMVDHKASRISLQMHLHC